MTFGIYHSFSGPYPQPYLFIRSSSEIKAIDLLTHDTTVVIPTQKPPKYTQYAMAIDTVDMKLYFGENGGISRANLDGTGVEVILKEANVHRMAIDWIGRRIFWTKIPLERRIFVVNLDGKEKRQLITTERRPYGIAVDSTVG